MLKDHLKTIHTKTDQNNCQRCFACFSEEVPYIHPNFLIEPRCKKTGLSEFPTRSDTNRAVQPQKMARDWKFRI